MKKKNLNIALIAVVLSVWGILIHRIVKNYFSSNFTPIYKEAFLNNDMPINYEIKKDTFNLVHHTRDPFLNTLEKKKVINKKTIVRKKTTVKSRKPIIWPEQMEYYGSIKGKKSKSPRAILRINGTLYRLEKNKMIENISIKSITRDSIVFSNGNERKVIFKNKK